MALCEDFHAMGTLLARQMAVLTDTIDCQALWLHLIAALQDAAICKMAARQHEATKQVETRWRLMVIHLQEGRSRLLDVTAEGGLLSACSGMLASVRSILAQLDSLWAQMRAACPRMHFVGDSEIAMALAHAHEPAQITERFFGTCFPGVTSLQTIEVVKPVEHKAVTIVHGVHQDMLALESPVATGVVPLHDWLAQLNGAMRSSLRSATQACMAAVGQLDDGTLQLSFPQQAVMLADACTFVGAAERAISHAADGSKPGALRQLGEVTAVRLETLSQRLMTADEVEPFTTLQWVTFRTLVLTGLLHRDAAEQLIREGASSVQDWAWLRQIRHQWDAQQRNCTVCVGDTSIAYGWEYSGGSSCDERLLLVRSDRALLAACMALRNSGSIALHATASSLGVPQQHVAQAMAATFGRLLVDVHCTPDMGAQNLAQALQVHPHKTVNLRAALFA